jgi:hypothetical protein
LYFDAQVTEDPMVSFPSDIRTSVNDTWSEPLLIPTNGTWNTYSVSLEEGLHTITWYISSSTYGEIIHFDNFRFVE